MRIHVYIKNMPHHKQWLGAFVKGLDRHGEYYKVMHPKHYEECDVAVFWGMNHPELLKRHQGAFILLERGHFQPREQYTSVGWNGLAARGNYCNERVSRTRGDTLLRPRLQDWKSNPDAPVLILGQVPGDRSLDGLQPTRIWQHWVDEFRASGREVIFRPHPLSDRLGYTRSYPKNCEYSRGDLFNDLARCSEWRAINSTATVEATLFGVPGKALDAGCMAYGVQPFSDRSDWIRKLAHTSWTQEEIETGIVWEQLRCGATEQARIGTK